MSRTLDNMIADADRLIEDRLATSQKTAAAPAEVDPVEAMVQQLLSSGATKVASEEQADESAVRTQIEKTAHAIAIVDTLINAPTLSKIAELEEKAAAQGFTPEQVNAVLEKNAAALPFKSVLDLMPYPFVG